MRELRFRDLFSGHAEEYARFRPSYPPDLFRFLASQTDRHELAWDCATGNGQAAIPLAAVFDRVIATDASEQQLAQAIPHSNVEYRLATAEASGIDAGTVDLVCCAQAAHWLDLDGFYAEARRVGRKGSVIALITYGLPTITERIDAFVHAYANRIVGSFWPPERHHVDSRYATLPFPFEEIKVPSFTMEACWTAAEMLAYLGTWSATRASMQMMGADPRDIVREDLAQRWGDGRRVVRWDLAMRVGRIS